MPEEWVLLEYILRELAFPKDMAGKKVLVTAGATREPIDPVRFITNHSSGKMGCALAKVAMLRGAEVTLVHGAMEVKAPMFVKCRPVVTAQDMFQAVEELAPQQDMVIMAAAVADYTPVTTASQKLKKSDGDMAIPLKRTQDILAWLGNHRQPHQVLCGFSMETENLLENSRAKLQKKGCQMICANSIAQKGAGFGTDTNILTLITPEKTEELPIMTKEQAAGEILTRLMQL